MYFPPEPVKGRSSLLKNADQCTHCGYCLPACPTYRVDNDETQSPRGRVSIVLAVQSGAIEPEQAVGILDHCLLCRACHAACPAGVRPAKLVISARRLADGGPNHAGPGVLFHRITGDHRLTAWFAAAVARYRRWGWQRSLRRLGALRLIPGLDRLEGLIPSDVEPVPMQRESPAAVDRAPTPATREDDCIPAPAPDSAPHESVALLCGCMGRAFHPAIGPSARNLLVALGYRVSVPEGFGCCGAPQRESGDRAAFLAQARRVVDRFSAAEPVAAVICDSTVCAVTARSFGKALAKDADYAERAKAFSKKVAEISIFLDQSEHFARARFADPGLGRLTLHDHCQARNGLGTMAQPRRLLAALPTAFVETEGTDRCCGAGGDYMLRHPETSAAIRQERIDAIIASGADTLVSANPGCMLNLAAGLRAAGAATRVRHLAELLWRAFEAGRTQPESGVAATAEGETRGAAGETDR